MGVITKINVYATEPTLDPDVGAKLDADIAQIIDELNGAIDNANIADTPKISASKIDLTAGGYVEDTGDEITGILEHIFDGVSAENVWRKMRASGNARIYEGLADGLWCISYNTRYASSAWTGRDITGVCWAIKLESDGFHVYYAASDTSGVVPSWTEVLHAGTAGLKVVSYEAGSVDQAAIGASAVGQGELKTDTATGSVSVPASSSSSLALTNTYSWWTGSGNTGGAGRITFGNDNVAAGTIGVFNTSGSVSNTFFIDERFIQASPPYSIGNVKWGHFLFVLRTIGTGDIKGAYESTDPPWGNRGLWIPDKNSPERMLVAPHNFANYWDKDPAVDGLEVVMVDLRNFDVDALKLFCQKEEVRLRKGVKPWQELLKNITIGNKIPYDTFGVLSTTGLTDRMKIVGRTA
jgi:hypothetical protein